MASSQCFTIDELVETIAESADRRTRSTLSRCNRSLHRIVMPILVSEVNFKTLATIDSFLLLLRKRPYLGQYCRELTVGTEHPRGENIWNPHAYFADDSSIVPYSEPYPNELELNQQRTLKHTLNIIANAQNEWKDTKCESVRRPGLQRLAWTSRGYSPDLSSVDFVKSISSFSRGLLGLGIEIKDWELIKWVAYFLCLLSFVKF